MPCDEDLRPGRIISLDPPPLTVLPADLSRIFDAIESLRLSVQTLAGEVAALEAEVANVRRNTQIVHGPRRF